MPTEKQVFKILSGKTKTVCLKCLKSCQTVGLFVNDDFSGGGDAGHLDGGGCVLLRCDRDREYANPSAFWGYLRYVSECDDHRCGDANERVSSHGVYVDDRVVRIGVKLRLLS